MPDALTSGSSYIADFLVSPPGFSWSPNAPGSDTREQKTFVFDVAYTTQVNGQTKRLHRAEKLSIPYSLGPPLYMLTGILGLVLGNVIKTLNSHKKEFFGQPSVASLGLVFRHELISLLTSVAIGFIVLLVLARNEIPTKGWYDSMALGVTLAILADDQLLAKIKGS